jgi:hypothetical protein
MSELILAFCDVVEDTGFFMKSELIQAFCDVGVDTGFL